MMNLFHMVIFHGCVKLSRVPTKWIWSIHVSRLKKIPRSWGGPRSLLYSHPKYPYSCWMTRGNIQWYLPNIPVFADLYLEIDAVWEDIHQICCLNPYLNCQQKQYIPTICAKSTFVGHVHSQLVGSEHLINFSTWIILREHRRVQTAHQFPSHRSVGVSRDGQEIPKIQWYSKGTIHKHSPGWWWLEHLLFSHILYWWCHHPNWQTLIFFRGVAQPPTRSKDYP